MKNSVKLISELISPTVEALELVLWGVEHIPSGKYSLLRIYIDRADLEAGIAIEDCEAVSRQVSALLDVEDPISGEYTLEVSSPGLDRPLFDAAQFAMFIGELANVKLRTALSGRRKFKGHIEQVDGETITLQVDGESYQINHADVDKANIVLE